MLHERGLLPLIVKKKLYCAILCLLACCCLLSSCEGKSSAETLDYPGFADPSAFCLTLFPEKEAALLNGGPFQLERAPMWYQEEICLSLREMVHIFGGTFTRDGQQFRATFLDSTFSFSADSNLYTVNGVEKEVVPAPTQINHDLYLSVSAWNTLYSSGIPHIWECEDGMVTFSNLPIHILNEAENVGLGSCFSRTAEHVDLGVVGEEPNLYQCRAYQCGGVTAYVMETLYDSADPYNSHVVALRVTEPSIRTSRGLQVGDTALKAWQLYGCEPTDLVHFTYTVLDGRISEYRIWYSSFFDSSWF